MSFDEIRSGSVIRYPYLWAREATAGQTEGRKTRPVAVALRLARQTGDVLLLLPITTKDPDLDDNAIEIPEQEKRRGGLDWSRRLWIILDEFNEDIVGRSYDLLPDPPLGSFSDSFFQSVVKAFIAKRAARGVGRQS